MCSTDNDTRIEFQNEIFTYFSLSGVTIMEEATNNFCAIVDNTIKLLQSACPKKGSHLCDASDFAYWQWTDSYFTKLPALGIGKESVAQVDPTIVGYPEINYFKPKFLDKLKNSTYKEQFDKVNFGSPDSEVNYSHLFYLPPRDYMGDMPKSSLFNLDTIQEIFEVVETMPDLYEDPTQEVNFTDYARFTDKLELDDNKQTYLLFVWMKYMLELTAMRKSEGGTYLTTNLMGLAQDSLQGALNWMSKEFPAYLYGNLMALEDHNTCEKNVKAYFREVEDEQIPKFCNDTLLNMMTTESFSFYASVYFTRDYEKMQYIFTTTGISDQAMQQLLTPGYYLERNLMKAMKKAKKLYGDSLCPYSVDLYCSNRELAYAQWFSNNISAAPPKPLNASDNLVDLTGAHHYKPELKTFFDYWGESLPENVTLADIWTLLSDGQLFNQKFIGDVLLESKSEGMLAKFNTPAFNRYLKMLMIEEGLGGLFIEKTVKEYIEGYEDKILAEASMQTLEEGGDPTIDPWISINDNPTNPINSTDCFFVGDDKSILTRQYGMWLNNRYLKMQGPQIKGTRSWETGLFNPWKENVPIRGTDGGQFKPLLEEHEDIWLFISDIMMPIRFIYEKDVKVNGMTGWKYLTDPNILKTSEEHEENDKYYSGLHGTLNLTSVMGAPLFASKGRNLDIGSSADLLSELYDKEGKLIEADRNNDDVFMIVEPWSGLSLSAAQRLAINFKLDKDYLFENTDSTYLLPYTYVKREFTLNKSQIDSSLGELKSGLSFKLATQITCYILGSLLLIAGIALFVWGCKVRKTEGLGDYTVVEDYKPNGHLEKKQPMLNGSEEVENEETKADNTLD